MFAERTDLTKRIQRGNGIRFRSVAFDPQNEHSGTIPEHDDSGAIPGGNKLLRWVAGAHDEAHEVSGLLDSLLRVFRLEHLEEPSCALMGDGVVAGPTLGTCSTPPWMP